MRCHMDNDFFIMMNNQQGNLIMPLVNADNEVALFATEAEARSCAVVNPYALAFGFEVFERGTGIGS